MRSRLIMLLNTTYNLGRIISQHKQVRVMKGNELSKVPTYVNEKYILPPTTC